jgi:hypothetical protein
MINNSIRAVEKIDKVINEKKQIKSEYEKNTKESVNDDFENILEKEKNNLIKAKKDIEKRQLSNNELYDLLSHNKVMKIR